jgi:hypothetical protein
MAGEEAATHIRSQKTCDLEVTIFSAWCWMQISILLRLFEVKSVFW